MRHKLWDYVETPWTAIATEGDKKMKGHIYENIFQNTVNKYKVEMVIKGTQQTGAD